MQSCTKCHALSPDDAVRCVQCQADLLEFSETVLALQKFQANLRVHHILLQVHEDACPACRKRQGAYKKDDAPHLPVEGCSNPHGCRCFYQPALSDIYP